MPALSFMNFIKKAKEPKKTQKKAAKKAPKKAPNNLLMSRELVFSIRAKDAIPLTREQIKQNIRMTRTIIECLNELYYVIKSQPFPYTSGHRFADMVIKKDPKIMDMLKNRHLVTGAVFDNDQKVFELLVQDIRKEIAVQYKALYDFMYSVEETHAFEAFRSMLELPTSEPTDEERHVGNFVNRRFEWLNGGPQECWLDLGLKFYNSIPYIVSTYKAVLSMRYRSE